MLGTIYHWYITWSNLCYPTSCSLHLPFQCMIHTRGNTDFMLWSYNKLICQFALVLIAVDGNYSLPRITPMIVAVECQKISLAPCSSGHEGTNFRLRSSYGWQPVCPRLRADNLLTLFFYCPFSVRFLILLSNVVRRNKLSAVCKDVPLLADQTKEGSWNKSDWFLNLGGVTLISCKTLVYNCF